METELITLRALIHDYRKTLLEIKDLASEIYPISDEKALKKIRNTVLKTLKKG